MKINNFIKKSSVVALSLAIAACGSDDGTANNAPDISNASVPSAQEMEYFQYTVRAIDIEQQALSFSVSGLPDWASTKTQVIEAVDSGISDGKTSSATELVIYGTPSYDDAGIDTVFVSVSDGSNESHADPIRIEVENVNREPTLNMAANTMFDELNQISVTLSANDPDADEVTINVVNLPSWLSYDADTATITGFAGCEASGRLDELTVELYDGNVVVEDDSFFITIQNTVTDSRCFSGKVLGGSYINNALVYLDANDDGQFNEGEPSTYSKENGDYLLVVSDDYIIEKDRPVDENAEEDEDEEESNLPPYDNFVKYPYVRAVLAEGSTDLYPNSNADFSDKAISLTADPMLSIPLQRDWSKYDVVDKIDFPGYNISPFTDAAYQLFAAKMLEQPDRQVSQALYEARYEMMDSFLVLSRSIPEVRAVTESDIVAISVTGAEGHDIILRAMYGDYQAQVYPLSYFYNKTPVTEYIYQAMYEAGNQVVSGNAQLVTPWQAAENSGN